MTALQPMLICDMGSTSGKWTAIIGSATDQFFTDGFNPVVHPLQELQRILRLVLQRFDLPFTRVHYYGTGVLSHTKTEVSEMFSMSFPDARIDVQSDLMGAARATCQMEAGIVGILGTGSNSCVFDGQQVVRSIPSLGYPLGDQGGGWQIGAALVRAYYYKQMPEHLSVEFGSLLPGDREAFLEQLHMSARPNTYLASFATFALACPILGGGDI